VIRSLVTSFGKEKPTGEGDGANERYGNSNCSRPAVARTLWIDPNRIGSRSRCQLRDLEELWAILKESIKGTDIPVWLGSESEVFAGARPIELLKQGKARDIVVEFRRLKAGEPV
jgi:hypothetical protein